MRLPPPTPLYLGWSFRRRERTQLNILRAGHAFVAQDQRARVHPYAGRGRPAMWFVSFPIRLFAALQRLGPAARDAFGRSLPAQAFDLIRLAITNDLMPFDYYHGGLARYRGGKEISRFISFRLFANNVALCHHDYPDHGTNWDMDGDKLEFERACRARGLPCVRTVAAVSVDGALEWVHTSADGALPAQSLFLKPSLFGEGHGTERWDYRNGAYSKAGADTESVDPAQLLSHVRRVAATRRQKMLIQEVLSNRSDVRRLAGNTLATVRLLTIDDPDDGPVAVFAFWRVAGSSDSVVDNWHGGGLVFPIRLATGELLRGRFLNYRYCPEEHANSPVTGLRVAGLLLPQWPGVAELGRTLHRTVGTSA